MGYVEGFAWPTARDRDLAALFYRHLDPQDLASRDPATVVGCVEHLLAAAGARQLGLAPKTVANHVSAIFGKLQVADRAEAMLRARDAGLG